MLFNNGRTEKMWALCGDKINIIPTSCQYFIHKQPTYYPPPHFLNGDNDVKMLRICCASNQPQSQLLNSGYNVGRLLCGDFLERVLIWVTCALATNIQLHKRRQVVGRLLSGEFVERMLIVICGTTYLKEHQARVHSPSPSQWFCWFHHWCNF